VKSASASVGGGMEVSGFGFFDENLPLDDTCGSTGDTHDQIRTPTVPCMSISSSTTYSNQNPLAVHSDFYGYLSQLRFELSRRQALCLTSRIPVPPVDGSPTALGSSRRYVCISYPTSTVRGCLSLGCVWTSIPYRRRSPSPGSASSEGNLLVAE